jgi:hypothetical protein
MTQDEITKMAKQVGMRYREIEDEFYSSYADGVYLDELQAFAKLVAAKEREVCAKLFDDRNTGTGFYDPHEPAEIIRAMKQ